MIEQIEGFHEVDKDLCALLGQQEGNIEYGAETCLFFLHTLLLPSAFAPSLLNASLYFATHSAISFCRMRRRET